jgi:protein-S-isoprenylcysteine O-methyltransferase Ste14
MTRSPSLISTLRHTRHYDLFTRTFGSIWFLLLALFVGGGLVATWSTVAWPQVLSRSCLCLFYLVLWLLILTRPPAISVGRGELPRVAAFIGTYLPWTITFFAPTGDVASNVLSSVCVIGGTVLMLVSISHLGRSFSLVPQARSIVQTGPYHWIRHPLYLAEEIAILGTVLQVLSPITLAIFLAHLAVQMCRIFYEENLLRQALPVYASYGRIARWRLVPYVW